MKGRALQAALVLPMTVATTGCYGLGADTSYPAVDGDLVEKSVVSPELREGPAMSLNRLLIRDEVCEGLDPGTETRPLAQDALSRFLGQVESDNAAQVKARGNLYWFEFPGTDGDSRVRLRLAVLGDAKEAADELHRALLDHGPGWWGLRRSNLSILAPKANLNEAVHFALKYKLVCWGMMSYAGLDDVYVIPGPYMEL